MIFPRGARLLPHAKNQRFFPRGPLMPLLKNTVGGEHSRADARAHARVLSLMKLYHSPAASQDAGGIIPPHPASRSARVRRRAPFLGGRLACRAIAPYHVVKMRDAHSLRVFNENYPLSRSFSLRVVGVLYPHTPPARVLHPRAPMLFVCNPFQHSFCQGTAPKNFAGTAR